MKCVSRSHARSNLVSLCNEIKLPDTKINDVIKLIHSEKDNVNKNMK